VPDVVEGVIAMIDGTDVGVTGLAAADTDDGDDAGPESGRLIRPYAMTGGRTLPESEISLEAQIQATARASQHLGAYRWEAAKVVDLVQTPMALIEIAARLQIPIGVARVLVADLVADGAVVLHIPEKTQSFASLLERVLDGVRNL
jgi:Protein of unknown function (DUF742)